MKIALEAWNRTESDLFTTIAAATLASLRRSKRNKVARKDLVYVIDYNDDEMRCGVMNGTIPFTIPDSGTTSSIGTKDDPCRRTGMQSDKVFILPSGQAVTALEVAEYPFQVRHPASEVHISQCIHKGT